MKFHGLYCAVEIILTIFASDSSVTSDTQTYKILILRTLRTLIYLEYTFMFRFASRVAYIAIFIQQFMARILRTDMSNVC